MMLGLRSLTGLARYIYVQRGDTLSELYISAGQAFEMPAWLLRLVFCGDILPAIGIIDDGLMRELQNATVGHVVCKRKLAIQLTDASYMDIPLPPHTRRVNELFEAVGKELGLCVKSFYLEIGGTVQHYGEGSEDDAKLLPTGLELAVSVSFASRTRWAWIRTIYRQSRKI